MSTTNLASPTTTGYTEKRQARFNDDGTLSDVYIFVYWNDGTVKHLAITFAGPPDYTFSQSGALEYPDGSTTSISVPPDGTFHVAHRAKWVSDIVITDYEDTDDLWIYQSDGSGRYEFTREARRGDLDIVEKEWHPFDSDGALSGTVHIDRMQYAVNTGVFTYTVTVQTLDGLKTVKTTVKDRDGTVISDTTEVTHVPPLVEPDEEQRVEPEPRVKEQPEPTEPLTRGPWPERVTTMKGAGYGGDQGGLCALPRWIGPDAVGETGKCEHWTDYYTLEPETGQSLYLGSRFRGVGSC